MDPQEHEGLSAASRILKAPDVFSGFSSTSRTTQATLEDLLMVPHQWKLTECEKVGKERTKVRTKEKDFPEMSG